MHKRARQFRLGFVEWLRLNIGVGPDEHQAADLDHFGTTQPVRGGIYLLLHAATSEMAAVERVAPLVVRADPAARVARRLRADRHAAVPACVVQSMQAFVLATHDDDRVVAEIEAEEVTRRSNLGSESGEQPAATPDGAQFVLVDLGVEMELPCKRVAGAVARQ